MATLAGIFVLVALLKPWDFFGFPGQEPARRTAPPAPSRASPGATGGAGEGVGAVSGQCYYTSGWRVFSLLQIAGRGVRSWSAVRPIRALGPEDRRIEMARIVADGLPVLGYCAPSTGRDRPPASVTTTAWQLLDDGSLLELELVPIEGANPAGQPTQALYEPPWPAGPTESAAWQAGRYVFRVGEPAAGLYERWFGVEIVPPSVVAGESSPRAAPTPSPSPSPSPSPGS